MSEGNLKEKHPMITCSMSPNRGSTGIPKPNFAHIPILQISNAPDFLPLFLRKKHLGDVASSPAFKLLHNNDNYKVGEMKANIY